MPVKFFTGIKQLLKKSVDMYCFSVFLSAFLSVCFPAGNKIRLDPTSLFKWPYKGHLNGGRLFRRRCFLGHSKSMTPFSCTMNLFFINDKSFTFDHCLISFVTKKKFYKENNYLHTIFHLGMILMVLLCKFYS